MKLDNYQLQLDNWLKMSVEVISKEKVLASQRNDKYYLALLLDELKLRKRIRAKYKNQNHLFETSSALTNEIVGTFSALGTNPSTLSGEVVGYCGKVEIKHQADSFGVVWLIESTEPNQTLQGTGILFSNLFSVVFQGPDGITGRTFTGLITYEILNKEIFTGTWTGLGIGITGKELLRKLA